MTVVAGPARRLRRAAYIGTLLGDIPESTVRQYRRQGILPGVEIGGHVRFCVAQVNEAISDLRSSGTSGVDLEREPLRDVQFIAALLGIKDSTVEYYARRGRIPRVKLGRHVLFIEADVLEAVGM